MKPPGNKCSAPFGGLAAMGGTTHGYVAAND